MTPRRSVLALAAATLLAAPAPVAAQCFEQHLERAGASSGDSLGAAVALSGEHLFVGAPRVANGLGASLGVVLRFDRDPTSGLWSEVQTLTSSGGAYVGSFGRAMVSSGDTLLVGAPRDGVLADDAGAVYVFRQASPGGDWMQEQQLAADLEGANFGAALDADGDVLVVGAPLEMVGASYFHGGAYVYRRDSSGHWSLEQRLTSPLGAFHQFGTQVAVDGGFIAVSAPFTGVNVGQVHLYRWDPASGSWLPHSVLAPALPSSSTFGQSLAMEDGWLLVGTNEPLAPGEPQGRVRLHRYDAGSDAWVPSDEALAPSRGYAYSFAETLALSGSRVVVGCGSGPLAFLYDLDVSAGALRLVAPLAWTGSVNAGVGAPRAPAVAIDAESIVLGNEQHFSERGAAQVFGEARCAPLGTRFCSPALANSTGHEARLDAFGDAHLAAGLFSLRALLVPRDELGYFLGSLASGSVPHPGGSDGVLCLSGAIVRFRHQAVRSSYTGFFAAALDLADLPTAPPSAVLPGETWYFQGWFRDGASSNFTDAIGVTIH